MASTDNTDQIPPDPVVPASVPAPGTPPTPQERVYNVARANLGTHLTLNPSVDPEVGCAEAVSAILALAGYKLPQGGILNVPTLISWMRAQRFVETRNPSPGCVITAYGGAGYGHTGIVMKYGVASNDSRLAFLGLFLENYSALSHWITFFDSHGSVTRYFIPV